MHRYLDSRKKKTDFSDEKLIRLGREFCSVLSGGGLLASKVDYWAGVNHLGDGPSRSDVEIFYAAWDAYCPEFRDGYAKVRLGKQSADPTGPERADLARFVAVTKFPRFIEQVRVLSDAEIRAAGSKLCGLPLKRGWSRTKQVQALVSGLPDDIRPFYLIGLGLAYCEERIDAIGDELIPSRST